MKHAFVIYQTIYDKDMVWIGESLNLKGCVSEGDTLDEALSILEENERVWLETAPSLGISIPKNIANTVLYTRLY